VHAAQAGDAGSLGLLLARHRASMHAVAVALLGFAPDAEDAVQEAAIVALRRIGDLRDPDAAGPWLRAVVRNECRARLRRTSAIPVAEVADVIAAKGLDTAPDPAEILDRHALGDWVWTALEELSPVLRLVVLLRYFTDLTSYDEIAALCGTPVGTVRSRLSQARGKLAEKLASAADRTHDDARALATLHRGLAEQTMESYRYSGRADVLAERWSPATHVDWPAGKRTGVRYLEAAFDRDLLVEGFRFELRNVVASREVVVWETGVQPPAHRPSCPIAMMWVFFLDAGRIERLRLYHPRA